MKTLFKVITIMAIVAFMTIPLFVNIPPLYSADTNAISVLYPDINDYVFKYEGTKLYWAYEVSCEPVKSYDCIQYNGKVCEADACICEHFVNRTDIVCDWKTIIPGPLLREILK